MKLLTETQALTLLQAAKQAYQSEIKVIYEPRARDCRTCPTAGACCTDAHFVNVHITRLEAVAMRETLARTPRLNETAQRQIYERAHAAVARYNLHAAINAKNSFRQTFACPLFEPNVGCTVHRRAKPAPCIQHACYDRWEDMPPVSLQWKAEHRVEKLNTRVYEKAWAWLPIPVWLALVDPFHPTDELARLAEVWRTARRGGVTTPPPTRTQTHRRSLPIFKS